MLLSFARQSPTPMRNQRIPGSAPALGCRRVRLAPDMSKMPPACGRIFSTQPAGARAGAPGGGRAPRDMALPRFLLPHRSPQGRGRSPRCPKLQARSAVSSKFIRNCGQPRGTRADQELLEVRTGALEADFFEKRRHFFHRVKWE